MPKYTSAQKSSNNRVVRIGPLGRDGSGAARAATQRGKQACQCCRLKKIRCDGAQPTCTNCAKTGNPCVYLKGKKRGRPVKVYTFAELVSVGQAVSVEYRASMVTDENAAPTELANTEKSRPPKIEGLLNDHNVVICPAKKQWGLSTSGHASGSGRRYGL